MCIFAFVWVDELDSDNEQRGEGHCLPEEDCPTLDEALGKVERLRLEMGRAHLGQGRLVLHEIDLGQEAPVVRPVKDWSVGCGLCELCAA